MKRFGDEFQSLKQKIINFGSFIWRSLSEKELNFQIDRIFGLNEDIIYDLSKIIVLLTEFNTIFALDSNKGNILWK